MTRWPLRCPSQSESFPQLTLLTWSTGPRLSKKTSITRYQEYVPQNRLQIDALRPTYEIYYESTLEYCVPIL